MNKSFSVKMNRLARASWSPPSNALAQLKARMISAGYCIEEVYGEADVAITQSQNVLPISSDSDLFFRSDTSIILKSGLWFSVMKREQLVTTTK
jgi:hypothetical protein